MGLGHSPAYSSSIIVVLSFLLLAIHGVSVPAEIEQHNLMSTKNI